MELLKYIEPMKHLPDRFSNLAFWRGVRKFKDDVVNALEYIDSWGENVELSLDNVHCISTTDSIKLACKEKPNGQFVLNEHSFGFSVDFYPNLITYTANIENARSIKYGFLGYVCTLQTETESTIFTIYSSASIFSPTVDTIRIVPTSNCVSTSLAGHDVTTSSIVKTVEARFFYYT